MRRRRVHKKRGGKVRRHPAKRRAAKRGGFLPLLPLLAAGIPAVLGAVSGAMDIAERAKRIKAMNEAAKGSGMRRKKAAKRKRGGKIKRKVARRRVGRGPVSDFVGRIPLLGNILGPITSAIGLGLTSPNNNWYLAKRGCGMLSRGSVPIMIERPNPMMMIKYPSHADMAKSVRVSRSGKGMSRRGHYRYVNGKRVHVRGSGLKRKAPKRKVAKRGGAARKRHAKRRIGGYNIFPWKSAVARIAYRH